MTTPDRRQDRATAATLAEALRMKNAFSAMAGYVFAVRRQVNPDVAERVLAGRYDPRQLPDQAGSPGTSSPNFASTTARQIASSAVRPFP